MGRLIPPLVHGPPHPDLHWTPLRVQRRVEVDLETGCWIWLGRYNQAGYGTTSFGGGSSAVYVLLWGLKHGDIPGDGDGMCLDHLCRNPACCNPDHLEIVTLRQNALRGDTLTAAHARKTHCPQGHPYDPSNTYPGPPHRVQRTCRICSRASGARWRAKRKASNAQ